jgi:hypothetical protein
MNDDNFSKRNISSKIFQVNAGEYVRILIFSDVTLF